METRVGKLQVSYSSRGNPTYTLDLWHDGLKKHRLIRGDSDSIVQLKANLQAEEWAAKWTAADRTADARQDLNQLATLLQATLSVDDRVDWESLKDRAAFPERAPVPPKPPAAPTLGRLPREPRHWEEKYQPSLGILDKLISSRKERLIREKEVLFASDIEAWKTEVAQFQKAHDSACEAHQRVLSELQTTQETAWAAWEYRRANFHTTQETKNAAVDAKRTKYEARNPDAITEYLDLVLSKSRYPDYFPQEFDIQYDSSAKTAIVDYQLPGPDDLPSTRSVKYIATRNEFEERFISDAQAAKLYDDVLYQITLRTVHELFESDVIEALDAVVINGIVTAINRTTGKPVTACVLSLRAGRKEFLDINLSQVDPKACFKSLKGVGSSKLYGLSSVPPIMPLRREDGRFISAYEVANTLDSSVNLAAMDWEDFEHLIREVFEKEFSATGGEVKVTQASRDGGVDAVAFDPDPIRGGKIVIQAKRYTNTVGVGAVRDLYGTVLNEGATKGVLVTTSDYGPDSYAFANGKPLVLLSGANLLHMLERHGHSARIDLVEAKKLATKA